MTPIEITGFAAIIAGTTGLGLACWAQRREIERLNGLYDDVWGKWTGAEGSAYAARTVLQTIADATRKGKSGTAKKVHRMAMEALTAAKGA